MHFQSGRGQCLNEDRLEVWGCAGTRWQGAEGTHSSLDVFLSDKRTEKAFRLLSPYVHGVEGVAWRHRTHWPTWQITSGLQTSMSFWHPDVS